MKNQLSLSLGKKLKEKAIRKALNNAQRVNPGWGDYAFKMFKRFVSKRTFPFRMEQFREYVETRLPLPPSLRAFGAIARRAKQERLIKHAGYTQVRNPKAHAATASLWRRV